MINRSEGFESILNDEVGGKRVLHLGVFNEYSNLHDNLQEIELKEQTLSSLFKSIKKNQGRNFFELLNGFGFSVVDDDIIEFRDGDFYEQFSLDNGVDIGMGFWYDNKERGENFLIQTTKNNLFDDNSTFSPEELFPGEWSASNVKNYLSFSNRLLNALNSVILKLEQEYRGGKISYLVKSLFK